MKDVASCDKLGEPQAGFDPEISEWGNPARRNLSHRAAEYIGARKQTQGSETSQYLEEEKSNEIP